MWDCTVQKIKSIHPIDNADAIELAIVGNNWPVVIRKGSYAVGELVSYFMADSIMPTALLQEIGLEGKLSGSAKNRIKPVRLRGQLSIGIVHKCPIGFNEHDSVVNHYGITKYEEPIPTELSGKTVAKPNCYVKYDIDNIRSWNPFINGEMVVVTEKLHGSTVSFGYIDGVFHVMSKNYSIAEDENNSYWKAINYHKAKETIINNPSLHNIVFHGELLPVQDLKYGLSNLQIRLFDTRLGSSWHDWDTFVKNADAINIPTVPILFIGSYSDSVLELSNGTEKLSGKNLHIREGCVIKTYIPRYNERGDRCILKNVSEEYLTRKNGSEYQ